MTVLSGVAIWAVDREGFPTVGRGLWWAAQTVTTVGYGDAVPVTPAGRNIAVVVMITGVGFLTVFTGAVVSLFVFKLTRALERRETEQLEDTLASITARLDRIERALTRRSDA